MRNVHQQRGALDEPSFAYTTTVWLLEMPRSETRDENTSSDGILQSKQSERTSERVNGIVVLRLGPSFEKMDCCAHQLPISSEAVGVRVKVWVSDENTSSDGILQSMRASERAQYRDVYDLTLLCTTAKIVPHYFQVECPPKHGCSSQPSFDKMVDSIYRSTHYSSCKLHLHSQKFPTRSGLGLYFVWLVTNTFLMGFCGQRASERSIGVFTTRDQLRQDD